MACKRRQVELVLTALVMFAATAATIDCLSIEREPVRVTPLNSGPKYEVDDVDKQPIVNSIPASDVDDESLSVSKLRGSNSRLPASDLQPALFNPFRALSPRGQVFDGDSDVKEPVEPLLAVRRFIIFSPRRPDDESSNTDDQQSLPMPPSPFSMLDKQRLHDSQPQPWHFIRPMFRVRVSEHSQQDSLSPSESSSPQMDSKQQRPFLPDPFQIMMELLHKAFEARANVTRVDSPFNMTPAKDLFNDESASSAAGDDKSPAHPPMKPVDTEETTSEIVEFDGEKFVKKTTIKKHIDHGVYFVTKKLSFVPLNETESASTTTQAPIAAVATELSNTSNAPEKPAQAASSSAQPAMSPTTTTQAPPTSSPTTTTTTTTSSTTTQTALEKEGEPTSKDASPPSSQAEPIKLKAGSVPQQGA